MTILQIGIEWFDKGNKPFPFWNLSIQKKKQRTAAEHVLLAQLNGWHTAFKLQLQGSWRKSTATLVIEKANPLFAFCLLNRNFALRI